MTCQSCSNRIQTVLKGFPGILSAKVTLDTQRGEFQYDSKIVDSNKIVEKIKQLGFEATLI